MYLGVVPDVLPLAPRPVTSELRSSWLLRVAAANVLTLAELLNAVAERHPHAGTDDAFLDDALSLTAAAAFAQFARAEGYAGVCQSKEEQHELHGRRPPMLELVERVEAHGFAAIEEAKIPCTVRHEGHMGTKANAGWKPPRYSAAHDSDPGPST
jgi:hypothetical protein